MKKEQRGHAVLIAFVAATLLLATGVEVGALL